MSEKQVKRDNLIEDLRQLKKLNDQLKKELGIFIVNYNQLRSDFIQIVAQRNFMLKCIYCILRFSKDILFTGTSGETINEMFPERKPDLETNYYSLPLNDEVQRVMDDRSVNIEFTANVSMEKDHINFSISEEKITKELEKVKKDVIIGFDPAKEGKDRTATVIHPMQSGEKH